MEQAGPIGFTASDGPGRACFGVRLYLVMRATVA
jgi:hypothetical protein